ncbi:MAG: YraN family protein [Bacteroidia bacterium]|nr:YraN family protein [Bacteroidia bacterium]
MEKSELGILGEKESANWLLMHGYAILATNWRSGKSEIDIVALDKNTAVFVEVKARTGTFFDYPESAVNASKQNAMMRAAQNWMIENPQIHSFRFDVIAIEFLPHVKKITHFKDAFFPLGTE